MENQQQRWVTISYAAVAFLVYFILSTVLLKSSAMWDWETKFRNVDLTIRIASIVFGVILFWALHKSERATQFMTEVVVELSRVTWPTQKETTSATIVVIVMVLVSGVVLGLFDYLWTTLIQMIL